MTEVIQGTIFDASKLPSAPQARKGKTPGAKERFTRYMRVPLEQLDPNFVPTDRDKRLLLTLAERRALTAPQVKEIIFSQLRNQDQCNRSLKLLYHYTYVWRILPRQTPLESKPSIYILDHRGAREVATLQGVRVKDLSWHRNEVHRKYDHFEHIVQNNWVRIWFERAAREAGIPIPTWDEERVLKRAQRGDLVTIRDIAGQPVATRLYPDHRFVATIGQRTIAPFIETDRDTEDAERLRPGPTAERVPNTWSKKVHTYNAYFAKKKGESLYTRRYGKLPEQVLTVTTTLHRVGQLKKATEKAGGKRRFWFTTFDQLRQENAFTGAIWQMAGEDGFYRLVTPS